VGHAFIWFRKGPMVGSCQKGN